MNNKELKMRTSQKVELTLKQIENIYRQASYDFISEPPNKDLLIKFRKSESCPNINCDCPECKDEIIEAIANDPEASVRFNSFLVAQLTMIVYSDELINQN